MKLALIFLSIFVAISHQQYFHPRMMFGFPWMSPFAHQQPMAVNDYVLLLQLFIPFPLNHLGSFIAFP
jgi:hypothetical protein